MNVMTTEVFEEDTDRAASSSIQKRDTALARLMKAWESKNARAMKRAGGLSFIAVTLAACNDNDDNGSTTDPGDDNGSTTDPGDDNGSTTDPEKVKTFSDAFNGQINMDDFPDIDTLLFAAGLDGPITVENAFSGLLIDVASDPTEPFGPLGNNITVNLKTDGDEDELAINLDAHDLAAVDGGNVGVLTVNGIETVTIDIEDKGGATDDADDASMTIAELVAEDITTLTLSGDGSNVIINETTGATALSDIDASGATGDVTIRNTNTADGAVITLGDGDDTFEVDAENTGADTFTLGDGNDTIVYTAAAQSDGTNTDTVTDFNLVDDEIDISALSNKFLGNVADTADAETDLSGTAGEAIFVQSDNLLAVDVDGDGSINDSDFQLTLEGITNLTEDGLVLEPLPKRVDVDGNASGALDADNDDFVFDVQSGNFTQEITNFDKGDVLSFFDTPDVQNTDGSDGAIVVQAVNNEADAGEVATVELTGLDSSVDSNVFDLQSFEDEFGEDALVSGDAVV